MIVEDIYFDHHQTGVESSDLFSTCILGQEFDCVITHTVAEFHILIKIELFLFLQHHQSVNYNCLRGFNIVLINLLVLRNNTEKNYGRRRENLSFDR